MVKPAHALLGLAALAGAVLLFKKVTGEKGPNSTPDAVVQSASPYAPILNDQETQNSLGDELNPFENGPQSLPNPNAATANYAQWGGTISEGGSLYAMINGVNIRNPSADLIFDRGLGVYR